jgi:hypothetical protein
MGELRQFLMLEQYLLDKQTQSISKQHCEMETFIPILQIGKSVSLEDPGAILPPQWSGALECPGSLEWDR